MEWREVSFMDNTLYMKLPGTMTDMSKEKSGQRFPYWRRPQFLKMDEEKDRILSISLLKKGINGDDVKSVITGMLWKMDHLYPQCCLTGAEKKTVNELEIGWFSYRTDSAVNEGRFHIMFLFALEGEAVLGSLSSPMENQRETEKIFAGMRDSIRAEKKNRKSVGETARGIGNRR